MKWYEKIIQAHLSVTDQVSHGGRLKSDRYFVWQEDGQDDLVVDGVHDEMTITGSTDLFTRMEFDPWKESFEAALNAADGICWELNSIQYEVEAGYWHFEWLWSVI